MSTRDYRKSTLVSVVPFKIREEKVTIYPSEYRIPAAKWPDGLECLVVEPGITLVYLDSDRGSMRVNIDSEEIANAIVKDWTKSLLGTSLEAKPGLFVIPGNFTVAEVLKEHPDKVKQARDLQKRWFEKIVSMADDDWTKYKQYKMISKVQRIAANCLNLNRDWLNIVLEDNQQCTACYSKVDPRAVICPTCRTILNPEAYKKLVTA